MPKDKDLKYLIRARQQQTGESYTAARARILGTLGQPPQKAIYPWSPEDGYTDNFWLSRAEREGQANEHTIVAQPQRGTRAFVLQPGTTGVPSIAITILTFNLQGERENEQRIALQGEAALALKVAVNRFMATSQAPAVIQGEKLPPFTDKVWDATSLELAGHIGPDFAFIREAGSKTAICLGRGRTMPAPNPSAGISIFWEDGNRISLSDTAIFGFPAGVFRAAVNRFVGSAVSVGAAPT